MFLLVMTDEIVYVHIGDQVRRDRLCVLDVKTFYCISLEQLLDAVLSAMQSQQCHIASSVQFWVFNLYLDRASRHDKWTLDFCLYNSLTGTKMAKLVCGGGHTLLMYISGATSVQYSCCHAESSLGRCITTNKINNLQDYFFPSSPHNLLKFWNIFGTILWLETLRLKSLNGSKH